jgi:hypothetical protein
MVRWPLSPEAQATRSFGICEQPVLDFIINGVRNLLLYILRPKAYVPMVAKTSRGLEKARMTVE